MVRSLAQFYRKYHHTAPVVCGAGPACGEFGIDKKAQAPGAHSRPRPGGGLPCRHEFGPGNLHVLDAPHPNHPAPIDKQHLKELQRVGKEGATAPKLSVDDLEEAMRKALRAQSSVHEVEKMVLMRIFHKVITSNAFAL